jgi:hypothetical protein
MEEASLIKNDVLWIASHENMTLCSMRNRSTR